MEQKVNPADKVERWKIERLVPYARNARTHSDEQVAQIAASIREWGWTTPVLVDEDGGIIAGHGRTLAAQRLKMAEVPVMVARGWSDAKKRAYILADNKLALNAGWENELLNLELSELKELDFDLDLIGFSADEIAALIPLELEPGLTDEDAVPEPPAVPVTVLGDVWLLGRHRVMCGDSTSIDAVEKLMDGGKAQLVITSPPYNGDTKSKNGDYYATNKTKKFYGNDGFQDNLSSDNYVEFAKSVLNNCFVVTDGWIFWNVSYNANSRFEYIKQIHDHLEFLMEQVCWKKSSNFPLKGSMMRQWEPIYIFSTNKTPLVLNEVTGNHWEISNTNVQHENHKACFPIALPEKAITIFDNRVKVVFEPFGGSGSTLIACEKTGRINRSMELDPKYVDVIIKRWQDFTGKIAVHAETNQPFAEVTHGNQETST
jgi:DNA modification methylase